MWSDNFFPLMAAGGVGAVLAAFLRRGTSAFALMLTVSWLLPFISVAMLLQVLATGPISYAVGGWPPPIGIEYRVDVLNAMVLTLVSIIGAVIAPFALRSVAREVDESKQAWFYCMYLLCLTGLLGLAITGDAFLHESRGNLVRAGDKRVSILGMDNIAVIVDGDDILIIPLERSQEVRAAAKARE